jgi:hypothetical protein
VPVFGYKSHLGIDRAHGLIRTWTVTLALGFGLSVGMARPNRALSPKKANSGTGQSRKLPIFQVNQD